MGSQTKVHRAQNSFGKCNHCTHYKQILKTVVSIEAQQWWCRQYQTHLQSQYADRTVYYFERNWSMLTARGQLLGDNTTVTMIVDYVDQAKLCVPRHLPAAKQMQDCDRPRLHMAGVIAHGWGAPGCISNSISVQEIICWPKDYVLQLPR